MRTRNERRRDNHDLTVFLLLCAAGLTALLLRSCNEAEWESTPSAASCAAELTYAETQEDPLEAEAIEAAVLATIGTEYEEDAFGYSFTELAKIISAEGGEDYTHEEEFVTDAGEVLESGYNYDEEQDEDTFTSVINEVFAEANAAADSADDDYE